MANPQQIQGDNRKVPESRKAQQQQEKRNTHDGKPHEGVGTFFHNRAKTISLPTIPTNPNAVSTQVIQSLSSPATCARNGSM